MQQSIEAYEHERFLRDHHHLISPFMYTADQIALKNSWFLMVTWHRFTPPAEPDMIGSG